MQKELWEGGSVSVICILLGEGSPGPLLGIPERNSQSTTQGFPSVSPGCVAQLLGASCRTPKGCRFDSWSRHIPRLQV